MNMTVNLEWPEDIPLPLLEHSGTLRTMTLVSPIEHRRIQRRSRARRNYATLNVRWMLSYEEWLRFRQFVDVTLGNGTALFEMDLRHPNPNTLTPWAVRFLSSYTASYRAGSWEVSATLDLVSQIALESIPEIQGDLIAAWPLDLLPAPLVERTHRIEAREQLVQMESGRIRKRRTAQLPAEFIEVKWHFTAGEFPIFRHFFANTLENGVRSFTIETFELEDDPRYYSRIERELAFLAPYSWSQEDNLVAVSATLEVRTGEVIEEKIENPQNPPPEDPIPITKVEYPSIQCKDSFTLEFKVSYAVEYEVQIADSPTPAYWHRHVRVYGESNGNRSLLFNNDYQGQAWFRVIEVESGRVIARPTNPEASTLPPPVVLLDEGLIDISSQRAYWSMGGYALPYNEDVNPLIAYDGMLIRPWGRFEYRMESYIFNQPVEVVAPEGATATWTRDGTDPTPETVVKKIDGYENNLAAHRTDFRYQVRARCFAGSCRSPVVLILVDKRFRILPGVDTQGYGANVSFNCDLPREVPVGGWWMSDPSADYPTFSSKVPAGQAVWKDREQTMQIEGILSPTKATSENPDKVYGVILMDSSAACSLRFPEGFGLSVHNVWVAANNISHYENPPGVTNGRIVYRTKQVDYVKWTYTNIWETQFIELHIFRAWTLRQINRIKYTWDAMPDAWTNLQYKQGPVLEMADDVTPDENPHANTDRMAYLSPAVIPDIKWWSMCGPDGTTAGVIKGWASWAKEALPPPEYGTGFGGEVGYTVYITRFNIVVTIHDDFKLPLTIGSDRIVVPFPPLPVVPLPDVPQDDFENYLDTDDALSAELNEGTGWNGPWIIVAYPVIMGWETWEDYPEMEDMEDLDVIIPPSELPPQLVNGEGWSSAWIIEELLIPSRIGIESWEEYEDGIPEDAYQLNKGTEWKEYWILADSQFSVRYDDFEEYEDSEAAETEDLDAYSDSWRLGWWINSESSIWPQTELLIGFDHGFYDESRIGRQILVTGNVSRSEEQKKFGTHSAFFDGAGDNLSVKSTANLGTDLSFSAECWFYMDELPNAFRMIFSKAGSSYTSGWYIGINADNRLEGQAGNGASNVLLSPDIVAPGVWHHVALCYDKDQSTLRLFLNGFMVDSKTLASINSTGNDLMLGRDVNNSARSWAGYIDEARFVRGGDPVYTQNFVPPSAPFSRPYSRNETAYKFYRVNIMAIKGSTDRAGVLELELRENEGGANLALLGTASASGEYLPFTANKVNDGLLTSSSGWAILHGNNFPVWVQIELPEAAIVREYKLGSYPASDTVNARSAASWQILGSQDGITWKVIREVIGHEPDWVWSTTTWNGNLRTFIL